MRFGSIGSKVKSLAGRSRWKTLVSHQARRMLILRADIDLSQFSRQTMPDHHSDGLRRIGPGLLLSLLSKALLSSECQFHHFFAIDNDKAPPRTSTYICKNCLLHLEILQANTVATPCPQPQSPIHHYHVIETGHGSEFLCNCCQCSRQLEIKLHTPVIISEIFKALLQDKDVRHQSNACKILCAYFQDMASNKTFKTINASNKAFATWLGYNPQTDFIFSRLGYTYNPDENCFTPPSDPAEHAEAARLVYREALFMRWKKEGSPGMLDDWKNFKCATLSIAKLLGARFMSSTGSDVVAMMKSQETNELTSSYQELGFTTDIMDASLTNIQATYKLLCLEEPKRVPDLLESLVRISQFRESIDLQEMVAIERSRGIPTKTELEFAYQALGAYEGASDEILIGAFTTAVTDSAHRESDLKESLRFIGASRDSSVIQHFLETGEFYSTGEQTAARDENNPAGIENIGNTCYLNSLLQLYYFIKPIREAVLLYVQDATDSKPPAVPESKTSGASGDPMELDATEAPGTRIEDNRLRMADEFVALLQSLFSALQATEHGSISLPRRLAEIALNDNSLVGQQQDLNECMDNVLDLLEKALKKVETVDEAIIKGLFYGKLRQSLQHAKGRNDKDEDFSTLIVELSANLYESLLMYFEKSQVDFEGGQASREMSILEAPPVLTIQIRRAKYDREQNRTYKCHDRIKFDLRIVMDQFMSANISQLNVLREELQATGGQVQSPLIEGSEHVYQLQAVFVHLGEAAFGHYFAYIWHAESSRWLKFNDSIVSEVPESEVLQSPDAYALIYVKQGVMG
ncbi:hypothetical protein DFS34DRAFT_516838 [Phlyctochytrium arcticum]|nr:hypothetical protein DFS34DRAFT_516838 [Phlyctochytrium arcticum]